jgi:excinuclease ABC subunit C
VRLVELACKNALEEAQRVTSREEKHLGTLNILGKMLAIEPPRRIESFDISNISGTDIVASMVVFEDGKPKKKDYKRFKIEALTNQDDYESMRQVVRRRFSHYKSGDSGFDTAPDLLLIDGGINHARVAVDALAQLGLQMNVFGMVKDDRHRTRALVTPEGQEIAIDSNQAVFAFIGSIQEETHRFAITFHRQLRSKRLRYSELDAIPGVGPKRKEQLLKQFKSLAAIAQATLPELERILPRDAANAVYHHFHTDEEKDAEL